MRYTRPAKRRYPKQARSIRIRGRGDDSGEWFKCWNCGFIVNKKEDSSGSTAGDNHLDFHSPSLGFVENGVEDRMIVLDGPSFYHTILEEDAAGEAKTIVHEHITDVTKGCPFCGTTNYRG